MDLIGVKDAVDKINNQTIPQTLGALHSMLDRLEAMLDRLDKLTIVVYLNGSQPQPTD